MMNGQIAYVLVFKRLSTNRLYGKAAEQAVLTARLTGILQHRYYGYNNKAHALSTFLIR